MGSDDSSQPAAQARGTDWLGWLGLGWLDELRVIAAVLGLGLFVGLPLRHALFTTTAPVPGFVTFAVLALVQFALPRRWVRARHISDRGDFVPYAMGTALALAPAGLGVDKGAFDLATGDVIVASSRAMNPVALPPGTRAGEGAWVELPATPEALPNGSP